MKMYLLKYSDIWTNEDPDYDDYGITFKGNCIIREDELKLFLKSIEDFRKGKFWVDDDKGIEYDKSNIKNVYTYEEISEDEAKILSKFNLSNIGWASNFGIFVLECTDNYLNKENKNENIKSIKDEDKSELGNLKNEM